MDQLLREFVEHRGRKTQLALDQLGETALSVLLKHPGVSIGDLAKTIGHSASGIGLIFLAYQEANRKGCLRETAKDLLLRTIISGFPNGWVSGGTVHPAAHLVGWSDEFRMTFQTEEVRKYAKAIVSSLCRKDAIENGWRPTYPRDELVDRVFDLEWPAR